MLMGLRADSRSEQKMATSSVYREALTGWALLPGIVTPLRLASFLLDTAKGCVQHTNKQSDPMADSLPEAHFGESAPHERVDILSKTFSWFRLMRQAPIPPYP
eukprot:g26661.t1